MDRQVSSIPHNESVVGMTKQEQLTQFLDEQNSSENMIVSNKDPTFLSDCIDMGGLGDFLKRPTLIHEINWVEGTPLVGETISPWLLFFNDPAIKRKIDNYAFISCDLHVKIMINSTPFLYGGLIVSYEPLTSHGYNLIPIGPGDLPLTELSQAPHVWVLPQLNQGGEMKLPFFYDTDWLELTSAQDLTEMGALHFYEAAALAAANGSAGQTTTIQVYAWAENVKLSGPTFDLSVQSGKSVMSGIADAAPDMAKAATAKGFDEYIKRPVSSIAATVAAMAKPLSSVPVIGSFAKATSIGASAVSKVAALFGWTNPPVIDDVKPVRHVAYHALSSASVSVPADTFTLDPKAELTVDPRTVGLGSEDEMTFAYIGGKESFIGGFTWETTLSPGADLFNLPISPVNYNLETLAGGSQYSFTPACMLSKNFKYWRGDVIVRLKFFCSDYHRGRVRVVWDPKSNLNAAPANTSTSLNRVIDINNENDVEIRIPFNQARHWLEVPEVLLTRYLGTAGSIIGNFYDPKYFNGNLHGYVINNLSAPEPTANIFVGIFVRMAPNFELCVPTHGMDATWSYFPPQAGEISISGSSKDDTDQHEYDVYMGDPVRSLRTILRRAQPNMSLLTDFSNSATDVHAFFTYQTMAFPIFNGYDPASPYLANSLSGQAASPFFWVQNTPYTLMIPCYKGVRGGHMWHYECSNMDKRDNRLAYEIVRSTTDPVIFQNNQLRISTYGSIPSGSNVNALLRNEFLSQNPDIILGEPLERAGQTLKSANQLEGCSVLVPNMFNYRFDTTRVSAMSTGQNRKRDREESVHFILRGKPARNNGTDLFSSLVTRRYHSVGPDFGAYFFLCVPRVYRYASIPTSA